MSPSGRRLHGSDASQHENEADPSTLPAIGCLIVLVTLSGVACGWLGHRKRRSQVSATPNRDSLVMAAKHGIAGCVAATKCQGRSTYTHKEAWDRASSDCHMTDDVTIDLPAILVTPPSPPLSEISLGSCGDLFIDEDNKDDEENMETQAADAGSLPLGGCCGGSEDGVVVGGSGNSDGDVPGSGPGSCIIDESGVFSNVNCDGDGGSKLGCENVGVHKTCMDAEVAEERPQSNAICSVSTPGSICVQYQPERTDLTAIRFTGNGLHGSTNNVVLNSKSMKTDSNYNDVNKNTGVCDSFLPEVTRTANSNSVASSNEDMVTGTNDSSFDISNEPAEVRDPRNSENKRDTEKGSSIPNKPRGCEEAIDSANPNTLGSHSNHSIGTTEISHLPDFTDVFPVDEFPMAEPSTLSATVQRHRQKVICGKTGEYDPGSNGYLSPGFVGSNAMYKGGGGHIGSDHHFLRPTVPHMHHNQQRVMTYRQQQQHFIKHHPHQHHHHHYNHQKGEFSHHSHEHNGVHRHFNLDSSPYRLSPIPQESSEPPVHHGQNLLQQQQHQQKQQQQQQQQQPEQQQPLTQEDHKHSINITPSDNLPTTTDSNSSCDSKPSLTEKTNLVVNAGDNNIDDDDDDFNKEPCSPRPRLSSMEPGTKKADFKFRRPKKS